MDHERVYRPLYKVADTPFHIQGDDNINLVVRRICLWKLVDVAIISALHLPTSPGINPSACIHHSICSNRPENWPRLNLITSVRAAKAWSLRLGHGVRASSTGDVIGGRVLIVPPSPPYLRPCPISHYLITESLFRILHLGSAPSPT